MGKTARLEHLSSEGEVDDLLREATAIVFKHSTLCSVSARAHEEVVKVLDTHPDLKIYKVRVIEDRSVSDYIEETTCVPHASPQILVLRLGEIAWMGSHFGVTAEAIEAHLG
jgi:bacillithiol system protein YtxJ